jgi:hypothetical protein
MPNSNFASSLIKSLLQGGSKVISTLSIFYMLDCLYFSSTSLGKLSATGQLGEVNVIRILLRNRYLPLHRRLILIHKYPQESQGRKLF